MNAQPSSAQPSVAVFAGGRFAWPVFLVWLPATAGLGVVAASAAVEGQSYFAPLLLFPILVGIGLGATIVGLLRWLQMGNRPTVVLGTLLAVAVAVVGQHYFHYRHLLSVSQQQIDAMQHVAGAAVARELVAPPSSFVDYMRQQAEHGRPLTRRHVLTGWAAWLSWSVDGLLTLAAALGMVLPAMWQPYCNTCRSWYRTIRAGRVPLAVAQRLADVASATIANPAPWIRYRLACCQGGCSPTRLELFWEAPHRRGHFAIEAWLDTEHRNQAMQALDGGGMRDEGSRL